MFYFSMADTIEKIEDDDIDSKFEELLSNVNIKENKKDLLRNSSKEYKRRMLILQFRSADQLKEITNFTTPREYIDFLENNSTLGSFNPEKILECLKSLRVALSNYPLNWVRSFGYTGFSTLCNVLDLSSSRANDIACQKVQVESLKCISKFVTTEGVQEVLKHDSALSIIIRCIDYENVEQTIVALQILAFLCSCPDKEVVRKVTFMLTKSKRQEEEEEDSFKVITDGISLTENEDIWGHCLQCINSIISIHEDVRIRQLLRDKILKDSLQYKLETLKNASNGKIKKLVEDFVRHTIEDELELELMSKLEVT